MTVQVEGSNVFDIKNQLGLSTNDRSDISITWRTKDYGRTHKTGCVVKVVGAEVPVCFDSGREAGDEIRKYLMAHDKWVRSQQKDESCE